ncbi:hypothetical protein ACFXAF_10230 [Kitasatospora sp. NPDC059463]|uniref:hypothetical protein n=1 Tax=unclassified Kitasatospora TaxID=2633591 RepID=UPI0036C409CB
MSNPRFIAGNTPVDDWQQHVEEDNGTGIYIDVDTSAGNFAETPVYTANLCGRDSMWTTTGGNTIYTPTAKGFRIYVRWQDGRPLSVEYAVSHGWYISWVATEV